MAALNLSAATARYGDHSARSGVALEDDNFPSIQLRDYLRHCIRNYMYIGEILLACMKFGFSL